MWMFAQAGGRLGGRGNDEIPPEMIVVFVVIFLVIIAIALVIQIFYLLTLSRCFSLIAPRNRLSPFVSSTRTVHWAATATLARLWGSSTPSSI